MASNILLPGSICLSILANAASLPAQARASKGKVDLTKIERKLHKEPVYESRKPRYVLMVFGPTASRKIWIVLDRHTLYVDKNSNLDLTDNGERISVSEVKPESNHFIKKQHTYQIGALPAVRGSAAYPKLSVTLFTWNLDYQTVEPDLKEVMKVLRRNPSMRNPYIRLSRKGKPDQFALGRFRDSPKTAHPALRRAIFLGTRPAHHEHEIRLRPNP